MRVMRRRNINCIWLETRYCRGNVTIDDKMRNTRIVEQLNSENKIINGITCVEWYYFSYRKVNNIIIFKNIFHPPGQTYKYMSNL